MCRVVLVIVALHDLKLLADLGDIQFGNVPRFPGFEA